MDARQGDFSCVLRGAVFVLAGGPLLYDHVKLIYNSTQLNGTQRVLLDDVLSEEECRELHRVATVSSQDYGEQG